MERAQLKSVLEAMIFTSEFPLSVDQAREVLGPVTQAEIVQAIEELREECGAQGRGLRIEEVAGGYRFTTKPEHFQWLKRLIRTRHERRFSLPALETLAIIAYRQPITKGEIESIRGVSSDGVLETLLERGLVKIRGRKEGLGRPILYGTTQEFLEYFGLKSLEDLPKWRKDETAETPLTDEQRQPIQTPQTAD
ncbi:MAG: SMC-Scp complex subunit ScpB [Candidatus Omnitrophica bacterium]|nr:SMC-Scp complex subunit ScpB [Candidatus Omnitrophota bacterium]